ncbi:MAG: hypothetical protein P9L94_14035 [Candidatus Hinthialibacter antarcticus]|nr:hypothetical protein [Candidatus Hinthialibacter antarcticus]
MSKKSPQERYADIVTRGLWILPRRRRNARREVLDHLEDAAEAKGIEQWSDESLRKELGPPKKLRKLFINGGLPWWARIAKLGVYFFALILMVLVGLDVWILWFYPVPNIWITKVQDDPNYMAQFENTFMPTPPGIKWQQPGDEQSEKAIQTILDAHELIKQHHQIINEAESDFLEQTRKRAASEGIYGTTFQAKTRAYWDEFMQEFFMNQPGAASSPMMMGMGMTRQYDIAEGEKLWLHQYAKQQGAPFVTPPLVKDNFQKALSLWNSVDQFDRMHFKRPTVEPEDIAYLKEMYEQARAGQLGKDNQPTHPSPGRWTGAAVSHVMTQARFGREVESYKDIVQITKDLFVTADLNIPYNSVSNTLADLGPDWARPASETIYVATPDRINAGQAPKLIQSHARWTRLYTDAVYPQPEPLLGWLIVIAQMERIDSMLQGWIQTVDDLPGYQSALEETIAIDYAKIDGDWPGLDEVIRESAYSSHQMRFKDGLAMFLSGFSIFKFQCSAMQLLHSKESFGYTRYKCLKRLREFQVHTMMNAIAMPNFENAKVRTQVARAKQAIAQGALDLTKWIEAGSPIDEWSPPQIDDPFQDDDLWIEIAPDAVEFRSAGPDKLFGDPLYNPSNGITSVGDIVWNIPRN